MRRLWWVVWVLAACMALIGSGTVPARSAWADGNLLGNPGFESGAAPWIGISAIAASPVHGGSKAARLNAAEGRKTIKQTVAVEAGARYSLSAWAVLMDSTATSWAYLSITWLDGDGGGLGVKWSAKWHDGTGEYHRLALEQVLAPAGAHSAEVCLHAEKALACYDDAEFVRVGGPPATATPTPSSTPTATATVRPSATRTAVSVRTYTPSAMPSATEAAPATPTETPGASATATSTPTATETATATTTETAARPTSRLPLILKGAG